MGQLADHFCSKGGDKFFNTLAQQPPERPEPPLQQLFREECDPEPVRVEEESVGSNAKREREKQSENIKSEALGLNPTWLVREHVPCCRVDTKCPHLAETA